MFIFLNEVHKCTCSHTCSFIVYFPLFLPVLILGSVEDDSVAKLTLLTIKEKHTCNYNKCKTETKTEKKKDTMKSIYSSHFWNQLKWLIYRGDLYTQVQKYTK